MGAEMLLAHRLTPLQVGDTPLDSLHCISFPLSLRTRNGCLKETPTHRISTARAHLTIRHFVLHAYGGVLQTLELHRSPFPSLALAALTALASLKEFAFDMSVCAMYFHDWTDEESAASALLKFMLGTPSLKTVTLLDPGAALFRVRVRRMLAARGATKRIYLH
jgi:hypothetical protein